MARRYRKLALTVLLIGGMGAQAAAQAQGQQIHDRISGEEFRDLLQDAGFRAKLETDSAGDPLIRSATAGVNYAIYFYDCDKSEVRSCESVQYRVGLDVDEPIDLAVINDWNREKRFGKAYLDGDADPYLEMNINLAGGITTGNLAQSLEWWDVALSGFLKQIDW